MIDRMENPALVSAIICTGHDPWRVEYLLPQALECLRMQTHPHWEAVIVCDNPARAHAVRAVVAGVPHRFVEVPAAWHLGAKRNAGLDAARGDFTIQWDDDDWYHPDRIDLQLQACLSAGGTHAVFLRRQMAYDFDLDTAYVREFPPDRGMCIHASVLSPKSDVRYPSDRTMGEDTAYLVEWLKRHRVIVMENDPFLYVRLSHGRNICSQAHIMRQVDGRIRDWSELTPEQQRALGSVLDNYRKAIDSRRKFSDVDDRHRT
jgi:glycosyltransferase involved in cell wall biosynthesis